MIHTRSNPLHLREASISGASLCFGTYTTFCVFKLSKYILKCRKSTQNANKIKKSFTNVCVFKKFVVILPPI